MLKNNNFYEFLRSYNDISYPEAEQLMERYTKQYEALPFTPFAA